MNNFKKRLLNKDIVIKGLTGSEGIAFGSIVVLDGKRKQIPPIKIKSTSILSHLQWFAKAKKMFLEELEELANNLDHKTASILETQKHIVSDIEIDRQVKAAIKTELFAVDFAIFRVFNDFIERLKESGSELFRQRIIDIENIRDRLIALSCEGKRVLEIEKGAILVVRDISPTDLVSYYDKGVVGLVMDKGGVTSHAAIIAQSLNIPCIVSTKNAVEYSSYVKKGILDGRDSELVLNPTRETISKYKKKHKQLEREKKTLAKSKELSQTKDGLPFYLRANIEFEQELELAKKNGAEGIGLLRTEALLYGEISKKSETEQEKFYNKVLSNTRGPVIVRLFDVGGDKLQSQTLEEANPFLGWRGIRMLLDEHEVFLGQLRAILKCAGMYPSRIKILVPMVSMVEEVLEVKATINKVQIALEKEGFLIDQSVSVGIMIEVPSVVLLAEHFAKEVDFFSIGTNDLTQYALAVDRGNEQICDLYQHYHPSIWQLIHLTKKAADEYNIEISVCGELAGDVIGATCLLGLGITDLSMSPSLIPKIKRILLSQSSEELKQFSNEVLQSSTSNQVKSLFDRFIVQSKMEVNI